MLFNQHTIDFYAFQSHNFYSTQPLTSNSMNGDNQSFVNSNHNVEANTSNADELFEKCPICYMIFPYGMTIHNRNLHVNEHY